MKIKRSPFQVIAFFSAVLIGLTSLMPARAFATGSADSIERWNIAMTDFSAGLPPPGLPPFVEWEPAFITPPVPDYPSGHAAAGAAAAEVLTALLGPNLPFQHTSTSAPGAGPDATLMRSYDGVLDAARQNAFSRMLVGIHFRSACTVGLQLGHDVARYVLEQSPLLHD
jgi:hypothetical protein